MPTKMEGEALECRCKKQGGRRLFGNDRSEPDHATPSLASTQPHQLTNAARLISQLQSFSRVTFS